MKTNEKILCSDIYQEQFSQAIKDLKKFKYNWSNYPYYLDDSLFKFADDDFYFYRFAINSEERRCERLLIDTIPKVLARYNIDFETPDNINEAPFAFLINTKDGRFGYSLYDYTDEEILYYIKEYELTKVFFIQMINGHETRLMSTRNNQYKEDGINALIITIQSFFEEFCSFEEYCEFKKQTDEFINESKKIIGYRSIKVLSGMNVSTRKLFEEKILKNWDYENYKYQIINYENPKIKKNLYIENISTEFDWAKIINQYINNSLYKAMLGSENYAESFITSEWLYYSLKGEKNFDYTAIVSGYLKSIEQLLYKLVLLNIDDNCVISLNADKRADAIKNGITIYQIKDGKKLPLTNPNKEKYPYIDFTEEQKDYMDSSMGKFEYFLKFNPNIFNDPSVAKIITDMVNCFRTECRNGYFHTHNMNDMSIVEKTRENAILLYAILLGSVTKALDKKAQLGIIIEDKFDSICKEIMEIRRYKPNFIFEYKDGTEKKMVYDFINNVPEYEANGKEHYDNLIFYEVDDFSIETIEKLDTPTREEMKRLLTRDNLPKRIYCFGIDKNIHEVNPKLFE